MSSEQPPRPGGRNLKKARRFVDQAEHIGATDPEAFAANLEAAIVFGKSVQDWLKDQYGLPWLKASPLWKEPLCKFFANTRDVIVHDDGSIEVLTWASVTIAVPVAVAIAETVTVRIIPGTGASRRHQLSASLRNLRECLAVHVRRWNANRAARRRLAVLHEQASVDTITRIERLHFRHAPPDIADRPAVDVVRDYLALLEQVMLATPLGEANSSGPA